MNILVLSCGTRNKIIQYFKKNLNGIGNVICADMSELAPALYEGDKHYIVPRFTDKNYFQIITDICKKEKITGVLSLIDPELSYLSKNNDNFKKFNVTVIGSPFEACELSLNKFLMYNWLVNHGYKAAKSYIDKDIFYREMSRGEISFPVIVKPIKGSASISIVKVSDKDTIEYLFKKDRELMIQEFLNGQEIGADVYIDLLSGEVVSIFTKYKILMRSGETDKSKSFKNENLFLLIEKFVKEIGYRGQIDIDIFEINGEYFISEVNPRFGGGYPHAYECGCNHMKMIINNLKGVKNERSIGSYSDNIYMMKYNEISILNSIHEKNI